MEDLNKQNAIIIVSSYNDFSSLAHKPKGKQAKNSLTVFQMNLKTGEMK